jgi:hypothetical protein
MLKQRRGFGRRPLWIIASYQHNQMEPLIIDPDGDGGFLPVFSFEEEAEAFLKILRSDGKKPGWWSRETTPGELVSVLQAPCAQVWGVALDPLPPSFGREAMLPLLRVKRDRFVQDLMVESRRVAGELEPV